MALVVLIYGPKAVGKTTLAHALAEDAGVHHVDADTLVLGWLAQGHVPHPVQGWLSEVEAAVLDALTTHEMVASEATGSYESDWEMAERLVSRGCRLVRVWLCCPWEVALQRLHERKIPRVPVSDVYARWIYEQA